MKRLFSEIEIKNLKLKNRICVPPLVMFYGEDGFVTEKNLKHYQELAKGGAGLIIQEATCVSPEGKLAEKQLGIWSDDHIDGLKTIVNSVHEEGVPILVQIHHAGVVGIDENPYCPDEYNYKSRNGVIKGNKMDISDIKRIQDDFVKAALRAVKAGYDGIELHGCHAYLISQFLSERVNIRDDIYGEQRELFGLEIFRKIKAVVPEDFIVGIRIGGFEPSLKKGLANALKFAEAGVDFLDVSYGFFSEQDIDIPSDYPFTPPVYAAKELRKLTDIPVFAVCGITSPEMAEQILEDTDVSMIDIGRGFLVNPGWGADAAAGKDTGKCLQCTKCHWRNEVPKCMGRELYLRK